jgi:hypothetical protein
VLTQIRNSSLYKAFFALMTLDAMMIFIVMSYLTAMQKKSFASLFSRESPRRVTRARRRKLFVVLISQR